MIKRLRRKIVAVTMVLLGAMLLAIFALTYHFTAQNLTQKSRAAVQAAASTPLRTDIGGPPCFVVEQTLWGTLTVEGGDSFALSDSQVLLRIWQAARETGAREGELPMFSLRFYRADAMGRVRYAFVDTSADAQILRNMVENFLAIGLLALGGFFAISIGLAAWAVRPVEKAWQQQIQFVADASHELKTPLTVILTNAELLGEPGYPPEEKGKMAGSILTMSRQMRALVESLLELARGGAEKQNFVPLDLSRLAQEEVLAFEPVYFESGRVLESRIDPQIRVLGDPRRLAQVLGVLLDNGVKYAAPGSAAVLTLARQGKNRCLLTVTTAGPSLSKEDCQAIFRRFYRLDPSRHRQGSYGLGLPIAMAITQRHGGKIWAKGDEAGNHFYVNLPTVS